MSWGRPQYSFRNFERPQGHDLSRIINSHDHRDNRVGKERIESLCRSPIPSPDQFTAILHPSPRHGEATAGPSFAFPDLAKNPPHSPWPTRLDYPAQKIARRRSSNAPFCIAYSRLFATVSGVPISDGMVRNRMTPEEKAREKIDLMLAASGWVVQDSQIRTVLQAFKDALATELFPGRELVPKTLVFCKDDSHAEDVVHLCREVFGRGNDFCKKITYQSRHPETGKPAKCEELIQQFRTSPQLRLAVTVDMIATGTDIKPLECLLFLRDVRSRVYFEQMKGRGTRVLTPTDLQAVSGGDARAKTHFIIVDAVGVCENDKTDSRPLENQPAVKFDKLLLGVALGKRDEDTLTTLAGRLARLDRELNPTQRQQLTEIAGGKTLAQMSATLLRAIDPDVIAEKAAGKPGVEPQEVASEKFEAAKKQLILEACAPFDQPALRDTLVKLKQQNEQTIDTVTADVVTYQGFDAAAKDKAASLLKSFRTYIEQHRAEITALQILYSRPYKQRLTEAMLKELEEKLKQPFGNDPVNRLWHACELVNRKSNIVNQPRRFADLVALVRFALEQQPVLAPFADSVTERFNEWLMDKAKAGVKFNPEQLAWLNLIRDHIATAISIESDDLELSPFNQHGGLGKAHQLFGSELNKLLEELNETLAV
jgi:type I restriction enzyme, R subunit